MILKALTYGSSLFVVLLLVIYFYAGTLDMPGVDFLLGQIILNISPTVWASLGITAAIIFSVCGAGW
jgi:hypothetical protein